ncbi:nuclear transport factor 2 family protein [Catenuloplanes atrovinosus]|uniref:Ketosteroid isomerase-like protein n=1 Tax=Catenuloplanes atrovinosus TaxID=137266 RepID=A0AAE3YPG4_9ACTN|nr:nuclear transport factor 2 family protein [Catenuloplanes atrovinosus]MDR7275481.1 ketosteroid isomerase-like protein [Catenuloplanes atrovinosus]
MTEDPREVFARIRREWFGRPGPLTGDLLAEDVVMEMPFAPEGRPVRIEGREAWLRFANPERAAIPVRIDGQRVLAVHDTRDPATIVVEYELTGTSVRTGRQGTAAFIAVLSVRDGRVTRWREYQDPLAMARIVS